MRECPMCGNCIQNVPEDAQEAYCEHCRQMVELPPYEKSLGKWKSILNSLLENYLGFGG